MPANLEYLHPVWGVWLSFGLLLPLDWLASASARPCSSPCRFSCWLGLRPASSLIEIGLHGLSTPTAFLPPHQHQTMPCWRYSLLAIQGLCLASYPSWVGFCFYHFEMTSALPKVYCSLRLLFLVAVAEWTEQLLGEHHHPTLMLMSELAMCLHSFDSYFDFR